MASDENRGEPSPDEIAAAPHADTPAEHTQVSYEPVTDNAYFAADYTYGGGSQAGQPESLVVSEPVRATPTLTPSLTRATAGGGAPLTQSSGGGGRLPPPPDDDEAPDPDDEENGMLRMSFLGHLEELRTRIFYALAGFVVAFLVSLTFCTQLWGVVSAPAVDALTKLGIKPPNLSQITPMEAFNVIWVKVPVLCSIFIASPWLIYQVWAFVSPGLYKRERRWAVPFVVTTAGLFISGGLFAYFVAFRYGLTFLLGIGRNVHVTPLVSINEYFDLFVNVTLGIGLVFELPVLIFFLTLFRLVTPKFLLNHSRYAILVIVIVAAVVTPTPDVFNLLLFATPMILLFYVGIFASYLLILSREKRRFPWAKVLPWVLLAVVVLGAAGWFIGIRMHYHLLPRWPFLSR